MDTCPNCGCLIHESNYDFNVHVSTFKCVQCGYKFEDFDFKCPDDEDFDDIDWNGRS